MNHKIDFPGVVIATGPVSESTFAALDKATRDWEMRAARGECGWICSDCCGWAHEGMPDECLHGLQWCTDIIKRDKELAQEQGGSDA